MGIGGYVSAARSSQPACSLSRCLSLRFPVELEMVAAARDLDFVPATHSPVAVVSYIVTRGFRAGSKVARKPRVTM